MTAMVIDLPQVPVQESTLAAKICRQEFWYYIQEFWQEIAPATELVPNWHIKYICDTIQEAMERLFRGERKKWDYIVNQPPGTTKSSVLSVALHGWGLTRKPNLKTIGGSHTYHLALDLSRKNRDVVQSERYLEYFPEVCIRSDQNTKGQWETDRGGMRYAVGVGGSVVGMHGDVLVTDDPIDPETASQVSAEELKKINRWCSETLPSRKRDKRTAFQILVMQRLNQMDPTGYALDRGKKNIFHICLPSEVSPKVNPPELKEFYWDGYLDPVRLDREVLDEAKEDLGSYGYAGQHEQNPVPRGGGMFKVDMINFGTPPEKFKQVGRYWDKAGTKDAGAYTVGFKIGEDVDPIMGLMKYWGLASERGQWDAGEREKRVIEVSNRDGRACRVGVEQEPGSGGKESAQGTARRLAGFRVWVDKVTGDKVTRADPFATMVNNGGFWLPGSGPLVRFQTAVGDMWIPSNSPSWVKPFLEELMAFPFGKYKDQVDASAGCFAMLTQLRRRVGVPGENTEEEANNG